jgi:hypothetical protein
MKRTKNYWKDLKMKISEYDFSQIIERLILIEGWSLQHAQEIIPQYRNFLYLKAKYGEDYDLPPSRDIDQAWHSHIINTIDYHDFCEKVLGYYLHHHPKHARDEKATRAALNKNFFEETQKLHHLEFGEYIYELSNFPLFTELSRVFNKYFMSTKHKLSLLSKVGNQNEEK